MKKTNLILIVTALITLVSCNENTNSNESQTKQTVENFDEILSKFKTEIPTKILTPDHIDSRIGDLEFYDGIPTDVTLEKVYENLDFIRGIDVFLNFIPATSIEGMRLGMLELGLDDYNKVVVMEDLMDAKSLFLTGNASTVYASAIFDLERDGATVVEVPGGAGPGTVNDAFFRFVVDMGAPGPDAKKGGMYIILPPDYNGDLKPTLNGMQHRDKDRRVNVMVGGINKKVWIAQSRSYSNWLILRGFLVDGKPDAATKMWKEGLKIYPLKDANNPKKMEFINGSGKVFNTIHANNYEFYEELWSVIQKEPISFIDPELRGQASSIGIIKGKPFEPSERLKKTLKDAITVGNTTARSIGFAPRDKNAYLYEGKQWYTGFVGKDYQWLDGDGNQGRNMDARTLFFYTATVNTPAMALEIEGVGSNYAFGGKDKEGKILYGEKNYKLNMPANVPAKDFWSIVVYDPQTRSMLQTDQDYPNINSQKDPIVYNEDGSVDLYFGPTAPEGKEANWIQTVPGKAWFVLFRTYGPLEPWFNKTWQLNDFERI
ncbi:DUF1254 domain-containing protein [uncultured Eudoraea sp.]|uniref:DUF1254 domain-containing protein n=1 Tax=uncultured Eudoraea sp. TaxID=1035614 RepID=UPI002613E024|nr:DUF1254 domain-containing protein [uncultured Eudoraea sp.]